MKRFTSSFSFVDHIVSLNERLNDVSMQSKLNTRAVTSTFSAGFDPFALIAFRTSTVQSESLRGHPHMASGFRVGR